jgi:adenylosuccinate lyase
MTTFDLERKVMDTLGLSSFTAATQVYSRKQDLRIAQAISNLDATLAQFAIDFRILMSPPIGEWSEPFGSKQVGSSAMPFKRNPINSEKIDSLARYASSLTAPLWQNTSYMLLERTLDDSANRRLILPSLFLTTDEILLTATKVVTGMVIHQGAVKRNLDTYGLFASSERLLMELGRKGADRQKMHEEIREASLKAWDAVQNGKPNPLKDELSSNATMLRYLSKEEIASFLDASDYIGDAPARTDMVIAEAQKEMQA